MTTLIAGTSYLHGAAAAETFRLWADLALKLNPGTDILVVDSASPSDVSYYPPPVHYLQLGDNIGHLARGGRDGWGRAFASLVGYAIEREYEWVASIECDVLFAHPVESVFEKMRRSGVKCCAPMASPYQFTETACSFWNVAYLKESKLVERYDWETSLPIGLLPEQRIDSLCAADMFALPMRGLRNDFRYDPNQLQRMFPYGIDWIHHSDLGGLRWFLEVNGHHV